MTQVTAPQDDMRAAMLQAEQAIQRAGVKVVCHHPFYATIWLRLKQIAATAIVNPDGTLEPVPTMATDGVHLIYNPNFVCQLDREELVGVIAHEVLHVAGLHPWRRSARDPKKWNLACDAVVNHIVLSSGLRLPKWVIPPVPDMSAEEVYAKMKDKPQDGKGKGKGKGKAGGEGDSEGEAGNMPGMDPGGCGGIYDPRNADGSALTEAQREAQMQATKVLVEQAMTAAKRAGRVPAGLEQMIGEVMEPKVPWKELLAQFIDGFARNDYSWIRPSVRYMSQGYILPSLWSQSFGNVAIGPDMSGSMSGIITEVCSEVIGCLEQYAERGVEPEIWMLWFDTKVYPQCVSEPEDLKPMGGGGTAFSPVFRYVDEEDLNPRAVIMITDGECDDFGDAPACPVLWILTEANSRFKPPFGEVTCVLNT